LVAARLSTRLRLPARETVYDRVMRRARKLCLKARRRSKAASRLALSVGWGGVFLWQSDTPILCVAGRSPLDEAAAIMLAELLEKHGLPARVEGADAIATSNIFRLDTRGIVMVFLSYLDAGSPAHMRAGT
jgi:hypothetical protein